MNTLARMLRTNIRGAITFTVMGMLWTSAGIWLIVEGNWWGFLVIVFANILNLVMVTDLEW